MTPFEITLDLSVAAYNRQIKVEFILFKVPFLNVYAAHSSILYSLMNIKCSYICICSKLHQSRNTNAFNPIIYYKYILSRIQMNYRQMKNRYTFGEQLCLANIRIKIQNLGNNNIFIYYIFEKP